MSIADKLTKIRNAVKAIKQAIINKGQTPSGDITTYPDAISGISAVNNQDKTITSNGTYTFDSGYTGLGQVIVNVPTSEGGGELAVFGRELTSSGILQRHTTNYKLTCPDNILQVGANGLYYAFSEDTYLTQADFSGLKKIGAHGMYYAFSNCVYLTSVDFSSLTEISLDGMGHAFRNCSRLTSVNFNSLTTLQDNALYYCFRACSKLTELYFPALAKVSSSSSLQNMLHGAGPEAITVHFPANLESAFSSYGDLPTLFGNTKATVLFDLPATS